MINAVENRTFATEMELLSLSATRVARDMLEELSASCAGSQVNDDGEVDSGGEPFETIEDVNEALTMGDALSRVSWGANAMNNRCYYIVDTGHNVTVKPWEDKPENEASIERVETFLEEWMEDVGWHERQAEVCRRLDRHGEVFDILYYDPDEEQPLKLSFVEPYDVMDDPSSVYFSGLQNKGEYVDSLGVRRTNNILYKPIAYFIGTSGVGDWYEDLTANVRRTRLANIPENATLIQHRKRNVLCSDPRGLTLYWPVREELTWAKRLLSNLMRVSGFQAAFGAIRTINAAFGADAVKSHLASSQGGTAGAGQHEKFDHPAPAVVTVPSTVKWEFPDTGAGASNHIEVHLNILRACASGLRVPEFMLTANVSEGNFASTLVSEGPFHKGMRYEQGLMIKEDLRILYQALRFAATKGINGLTDADIDAVVLEIKPPRVQTRNRKEDFEVNQKLWEDSLLSGKDFLASEDRDYESQQQQITLERAAEQPAPVAVTGPVTPTGPVPGIQADPVAEKGVLAGEPQPVPES